MAAVLLLGAKSDMSTAIAKTFASHGYDIQLAARNSVELKPFQTDLTIRYSIKCDIYEFDALQFDAHQLFFDSLAVKPDVSICIFGYLGDNEKARSDWNEAESIINSNFTGAISILNIISNHYVSQHSGTIVGISSVAGERGRQSNYIYGSAKAGFTAYLSGLRNRMYKEKVHVLTVQPGFVHTKMTENLNLPKLLTANPSNIGDAIYKAVLKKRDVIYVLWFWKYIMLVIKFIPEAIFKRLKL